MPLAIVEEPSQGSGNGDSEPGHADIAVGNGAVAKTLKRSPYLSEMTKTADSDLMALLSRPAGRGGGGRVTGGAAKTGGGGVDFLQLNRPELDGGCASKVGVFTSPMTRASAMHSTTRPHQLALRSNHQLRPTQPSQANLNKHEMEKNTSVTFSQNDKQGSRSDIVGAQQSPPFAAVAIANGTVTPIQQLRDRSPSINEESPSTQQQRKKQEGKNHFPFYFDTLKDTHVVTPSPLTHDSASEQPFSSSQRQEFVQERTKIKAKSVNTLQYYYEAGMSRGISAQNEFGSKEKGCFTQSLRNLTFRDMLDEGDGKEGDLNLHLRNEQWKVFRMSACGTQEGDDEEGNSALMFTPEHRSGSVSGSKRVPTLSLTHSIDDMGGQDTVSSGNNNMKNTNGFPLTPTMTTTNYAQSTGTPQPLRNLVGSHRGCVSAYDLAVFRRAASRIKISPQMPSPGASNCIEPPQSSQQRPGETLGAIMLSRLSSLKPSDTCDHRKVTPEVSSTMAAQASPSGPAIIFRNSCPLAEMRESKLNSGMAKQQAQLPLSSKLMKRRVHTVSAGLAYGSTGFQMDTNTRMSRFELGKETANILSTSSEGSGQSCYTMNEEWS